MKHRSRTEIIAEILEDINKDGGKNQTKLMFKACLSYNQLKGYLMLLIQNGLLEYYKEDRIYKITEKVMRLLDLYSQLREVTTAIKQIERV
jgi:predicted transcriptional regulator